MSAPSVVTIADQLATAEDAVAMALLSNQQNMQLTSTRLHDAGELLKETGHAMSKDDKILNILRTTAIVTAVLLTLSGIGGLFVSSGAATLLSTVAQGVGSAIMTGSSTAETAYEVQRAMSERDSHFVTGAITAWHQVLDKVAAGLQPLSKTLGAVGESMDEVLKGNKSATKN